MSRKVIVLDIAAPKFLKNKILDPSFVRGIPGASMWPILKDLATSEGWEVLTADVLLEQAAHFDEAVCISCEATRSFKEVQKKGVTPKIVFSAESPNVAWDFYHQIRRRSRPFAHAVVFNGFRPYLASGVQPHAFYWPNEDRDRMVGEDWERRGLLTMVSSCKSRIPVNYDKLLSRLARFPRWIIFRYLQIIDSKLRFKDLYAVRLGAIKAYGARPEFRLYGWGWQAARYHNRKIKAISFYHPPMECDNKRAILAKSRFALCLENCIYPSYITEKIFDAFLSDCIPVYLGAPDITDYVPKACFIDLRDFDGWDMLWDRLITMTQAEWNAYRSSIENYLSSEDFNKFRDHSVARQFYELAVCDSSTIRRTTRP